MINGVLVERTVKEVVPALKTNSDGLKKVLDELLGQYKTKQDEMDKWKVCSDGFLWSLHQKDYLISAWVDSDNRFRKRTTCKWFSSDL
jgi:hypothetical protein